ncbi:MAG: hypothetical protein DLM53_12785 [Candidatus Eremiobacter antarcticus]|nr:helix-turn-helix domain-containing protein [Candidatus Eremiobacteraeota bacterium]MBC5807662.1 helix-turn-helix domain-containing protein [Candidatus Eremiobacteraeota bacterium]PZR60514.1 MAG: hypothetical protein DLM53_12785 [Candidatus Eremiobacter sp. RRmetagenome_bin22]
MCADRNGRLAACIEAPVPVTEAGRATSVHNAEALPAILTVDEARRLLRVSRDRLYRSIAAGELPVLRLGRVIRIARDPLLKMMNSLPKG